MPIEVELRSFISKNKFEELLLFFKNNAEYLGDDNQETFYFDSKEDVRIQRNNSFSKIWIKKGKIHDECREEIEIRFDRDDFEKAEQLFTTLGFPVQIKWFRKRHSFKWQDITVTIDDTKGYGFIIELEKMSDEENKDASLKLLQQKFAELNIPLTARDVFEQRFQQYKENWKNILAEQQPL
ncbi:CYTH domain-containing protein [Candidatus Woesearchaeota archaeon]|nr:CYTH domain-containing protein [Candidatus Woesearchaeota archaeon]